MKPRIFNERREYKKLKAREYATDRRNVLLKLKYGITAQEYAELHAKQNGLCAICKQPESRISGGTVCKLSVDHCHTTDKIRGLLCHSCNHGLGYFKDNATNLRIAAVYLEVANTGYTAPTRAVKPSKDLQKKKQTAEDMLDELQDF